MLFSGEFTASGRLLIIDDDAINRAILDNIFSPYYETEEAEDGREGLDKILARPDAYCAVLLDVIMPEMDGLEVLERLHSRSFPERTPVFLITAEASDETMRRAYDMGVMDVISKPVVPYIVLKRVQSVIELYQARKRLSSTVASQQTELLEQAQKIIRLNQGMIEALSTAIEFRSEESGDHVRRIHDITWHLLTYTPLGDGLDEETVRQIALASIMHDVGKIAIPDAILNKPGKLTAEEYEIMKTHTTQGALLLERIRSCARPACILTPPISPGIITSAGTAAAIPTACAEMKSPYGRRWFRWRMCMMRSSASAYTRPLLHAKRPSR